MHEPVTRRIADVGAAVIGTGFIGTVHVEALRRIGVQVRGVLGSTPERGAARADALGVPRAYRHARRRSSRIPRSTSVHVTSPEPPACRQTREILPPGKHVVCEKPLAMTAERIGGARRAGRRDAASSTRSNFNIRFYPLNQHAHEFVADGGLGDVRL